MTDQQMTIYAAALGAQSRQQVLQGMRYTREQYELEIARLQMLVAELQHRNAMLTDALNAARERAVYSG